MIKKDLSQYIWWKHFMFIIINKKTNKITFYVCFYFIFDRNIIIIVVGLWKGSGFMVIILYVTDVIYNLNRWWILKKLLFFIRDPFLIILEHDLQFDLDSSTVNVFWKLRIDHKKLRHQGHRRKTCTIYLFFSYIFRLVHPNAKWDK